MKIYYIYRTYPPEKIYNKNLKKFLFLKSNQKHIFYLAELIMLYLTVSYFSVLSNISFIFLYHEYYI